MKGRDAYQRGVEEFQKGNLSAAAELFRESLRADPESYRAYAYLGMTCQKLGSADAAIDAYLRSILIEPNYHKAYNNLGEVYRQCGRIHEARKAFEAAVQIMPSSEIYQYNLGLVCRDLGDLVGAREAFRKAAVLAPDDGEILSELTALLHEMREFDEAQRLLEGFLARNPGHPRAPEFEVRLQALRKKNSRSAGGDGRKPASLASAAGVPPAGERALKGSKETP